MVKIKKIVSGGQSGADRAALDFAIQHGIPYGGYVPLGGWAEDFTEPPGVLEKYPKLKETDSEDPLVRTRKNVDISDVTLVVKYGPMVSPGSEKTVEYCDEIDKPRFLFIGNNFDYLIHFLDSFKRDIVLNVAGPRESESARAYVHTLQLLERIMTAP